ncbi:MAG: trypsin-like peptidase domain-containing protein [Lachnospiraceae bacterium]|nr:trypsin-like peptidase domain-containing protein [Lachnospiraceae bacterium]
MSDIYETNINDEVIETPVEESENEDSIYHYSYRKAQQEQQEQEETFPERTIYSPLPDPEELSEKKQKRESFLKKLARVAAYGLVFGLVAGAAFNGVSYGMRKAGFSSGGATQLAQTPSVKPSGGAAGDLTTVAESVLPSIVSISGIYQTTSNSFFFGETTQETEGSGSGIIIGKDKKYIYVATNNHVVESSKSLGVGFCDETNATAEIKGTDRDADLAVVQVPLSEVSDKTLAAIKIISLGDSDALKVGEQAIAIGNALGYGQSVTGGYISAVNREVELTDKTMTLIQTDAAINPGNSGGALLNSSGQLIGINTVKFSAAEVEGMGYAIPINTAYPIIKNLINEETIPESKQAYMGITGTDITQEMAAAYDMPKGIYIREIMSGSPAQKCGMEAGDVLVEFDGKAINNMESLQAMLSKKKAGTKAKVKVKRQTQTGEYKDKTLNITLGAKSQAMSR